MQTGPSPQRLNGVLLVRSALPRKPSVYGQIIRLDQSAIGKLIFNPFFTFQRFLGHVEPRGMRLRKSRDFRRPMAGSSAAITEPLHN